MSIAQIPGGITIPAYFGGIGTAVPANGIETMNAAGEAVAFCITAPMDGVLNRFEFRTGTVTNAPDNGLRVSFQDLDANGDPDLVQDQFRDIAVGAVTSNTWISPGLITSDGTNGGVKRTVSKGQRFACVIEFVTFVAADALAINVFQYLAQLSRIEGNFFYSDFITGGVWTKTALGTNLLALEYETTGYVPLNDFALPAVTWNTRTYNSGTVAADEIALRFRLPFDAECDGAWARVDIDGDAEIRLYDGTTVIASAVLDASARFGTSAANVFVSWDAVSLSANTTYRLSVTPTTVTSIGLITWNPNSAALMAAASPGAEWYRSDRVDAGAWADTTSERPLMGLHLNGVGGAPGGGVSSAAYIG